MSDSSQIAELKSQLTNQNQSYNVEDLFSDDSEDEEETSRNYQALIPYICQNLDTPKGILR